MTMPNPANVSDEWLKTIHEALATINTSLSTLQQTLSSDAQGDSDREDKMDLMLVQLGNIHTELTLINTNLTPPLSVTGL